MSTSGPGTEACSAARSVAESQFVAVWGRLAALKNVEQTLISQINGYNAACGAKADASYALIPQTAG